MQNTISDSENTQTQEPQGPQESQEPAYENEIIELPSGKQRPAQDIPILQGQSEEEIKWKTGDILTMVRVRFPGNAKSFPFLIGKRIFAYGQKVVAMSDRGIAVGYINSFPYEVKFHASMLPLRSIQRVASEDDFEKQRALLEKEVDAEILCKELIEKHKLDMILTHVEFIQFGKKGVFYFIAPARVDFRTLVKDLVFELKTRIELRQISVRDRTAALGAIGACGLQTCCSSFLKNYGNVSIKMAKNQNLALIPSKINGVCGQLKCCIKYEDDVYHDKKKRLPKEGSFIQVKNNDIGKVLKVQILTEQFVLLTDAGKKRTYASNQLLENGTPPAEWKFPDQFRNIIDETKQVIGLTKEEDKTAQQFNQERAKTYEEIGLDEIENKELLEIERSNKKFKWEEKSNANSMKQAADPTFKTKDQTALQEEKKPDNRPGLLDVTGSKKKPRPRRNRNRNRNKT